MFAIVNLTMLPDTKVGATQQSYLAFAIAKCFATAKCRGPEVLFLSRFTRKSMSCNARVFKPICPPNASAKIEADANDAQYIPAPGSKPRGGVMSILFVLLMFLLVISVRSFVEPKSLPALEPENMAKPQPPLVKREYGFEIPQGYCFHLGHTWVMKEDADDARVGVDQFVTNLLGKIDHIDVCGANRWVRQGQKLISLTCHGTTVDLVSPVEGVVMAINNDALNEPSLVASDPYQNGWIAVVRAPDLKMNERNLIQGSMVAPWMQNNLTRLNSMLSGPSPALAQDGGGPVSGLLTRLTPELRERVVKEFLLS